MKTVSTHASAAGSECTATRPARQACSTTARGSSVVIVKVSSDEPDDANADGFTINDIVIANDCKSVQLRAERKGDGNGRVYIVTLRVTDSDGNITTTTAKVTVPHAQNGNPAVDSGVSFTVLSNCP